MSWIKVIKIAVYIVMTRAMWDFQNSRCKRKEQHARMHIRSGDNLGLQCK